MFGAVYFAQYPTGEPGVVTPTRRGKWGNWIVLTNYEN